MDLCDGHAFVSYVREDSHDVYKLQQILGAAGVPVWRDTADLWPGEDWRAKIRSAITDNALVFIACFSSHSAARPKSYQNEELTLAIEQLRLRHPGDPWLIPVRFDDCKIPALDIGAGRTLDYIQRIDLFGDRRDAEIARLVATVRRILGPTAIPPRQQTAQAARPVSQLVFDSKDEVSALFAQLRDGSPGTRAAATRRLADLASADLLNDTQKAEAVRILTRYGLKDPSGYVRRASDLALSILQPDILQRPLAPNLGFTRF